MDIPLVVKTITRLTSNISERIEMNLPNIVEIRSTFNDSCSLYYLLQNDMVMSPEHKIDSFYFFWKLKISPVAHMSQGDHYITLFFLSQYNSQAISSGIAVLIL